MRDETEGSRPKLIANPQNNEFKYWPDTSAHLGQALVRTRWKQMKTSRPFTNAACVVNPFLRIADQNFIRSIVWTAFVQWAPAATTKYVRISMLVVFGVSSRVLSNHGDGDMIPAASALRLFDPLAWSRHQCKGWDKELSIDALRGEIGRSYEGLWLPWIQTSMYVVTVTQKLLRYISYCLYRNIVHGTMSKKIHLRSYRDSNSPNPRHCCSNIIYSQETHPWDKDWGWSAQNSVFSGWERFFLGGSGKNIKN